MSTVFPQIDPMVQRLVRRTAREILIPSFRNLSPEQIRHKTPRDVVTDIDEAAEECLSQGLTKLIPDSVVVGEENCHREPSCINRIVHDEWVWLVDPIDGTNNFIRHADEFGIMVSLLHRGRPQAGWIYLPVYDIFISGSRGGEVKRNDKTVTLSPHPTRTPQQLRALYRLRDKEIEDGMAFFPMRHDTHCNAFDFNLLISGDADFIVYPGSNPWDIVSGAVLIEALGGCAAKIDGTRLEKQGLLGDAPFLATRTASDWPQVSEILFNYNMGLIKNTH